MSVAICIFTAVIPEARPLLHRLGLRHQVMADPFVWQGTVKGRQVRVVVTGMGPQRAASSALAALREQQPGHVLISGLCGGLDANLSAGQVVQFSEIVDDPTGKAFYATGGESIRHRLVSTRTVVSTRASKADLYERRQAAAVDMESAALAGVCEHLKLRWSCMRAICDPADQALPEPISRIVRPDGTTSAGMALRTALLGPHRLPGMIRLGRRSAVAARALARAVEVWTHRQLAEGRPVAATPVTADVDERERD